MAISERLLQLRGGASELLSSYAQGYTNNQFVGNTLFPVIDVDSELVRIPNLGKEHLRLYHTRRALRGQSNIATPDGFTETEVELFEHDIAFPMDYKENRESQIVNLPQYLSTAAAQTLYLEQEADQVTAAEDSSAYPSDHVNALTSTYVYSSDYNTNANSQPVNDLLTGMEKIRDDFGHYPNSMVIGSKAWISLRNHPLIKTAILGPIYKGAVSVQQFADYFAGFGNQGMTVQIGSAFYEDSQSQGTFTQLWNDVVVMAYVTTNPRAQRSFYDRTFGYTMQLRDWPAVDSYTEEGGKITYIRGTNLYVVSALDYNGAYLISGVNTPGVV